VYSGTKQTEQAAAEVIAAAVRLGGHVDAMTARGVWAGADAERFRADWREQVTSRLDVAIGLLLAVDFVDLVAAHA